MTSCFHQGKKYWNLHHILLNPSKSPSRDYYHTKWSKPGRERQISYTVAYLWNLKKKKKKGYKWTYLQNRCTDIENKLRVIKVKRGGKNSEYKSWWWTGRPGVLWFMGSQRVGHNWVTELNWIDTTIYKINNKDLLYRRGNYTENFVITYKEKEAEKEDIYACVCLCVCVCNRITVLYTWS